MVVVVVLVLVLVVYCSGQPWGLFGVALERLGCAVGMGWLHFD